MAEIQRLIRKLQPKGPRSFDEQTWPIYVAIVVLCGYLSGVAISWCKFNDERIHANAFTWLIVIAVLGIAALSSVRYLGNRIMRRTIVLSFLLSLIVNVSFLLMLAWTSIFANPWNESDPRTVAQEESKEVVIPEYSLFNQDEQQRIPQEYEKPVETGEPDAAQRVELTRQATQPIHELADVAPTIRSQATQQQTSTKPSRAELPSTPRQSPTMSQLSSQLLAANETPTRTPLRKDLQTRTDVPLENTEVASSNSSANSQSSSQANSQSSSQVTEPLTATTPQQEPRPDESETRSTPTTTSALSPADVATNVPVDAALEAPMEVPKAQLSRQSDTTEPEPKIASLPTLTRRLRQPRSLPKTTTPVESQLSESKVVKEAVEPNSTLLSKQKTSSPDQAAEVELQPKIAVDTERANRLDQPESETLSSSLAKSTLAKPTEAAREQDTSVETLTEAAETAPTPEQVASSSTNVRQRQNSAPRAESVPTPAETSTSAETSKSARDSLVASSQAVARATRESQPSLANKLASRRSPVRASMASKQITGTRSQVEAAIEATSPADTPSPATEPSRMALSQSNMGIAGVGAAANLDRGVAAPETPINIPSAAANRARATQEANDGPALSPSSPALARQMRASNSAPRTSMQAQPIKSAMVPGATSPANEAQSSSATLEQLTSNAASSNETAAKGTTEVDLGAPRIAADLGEGRAEGGGQPEISTGEQPRALPKKNLVAGRTGVNADTTARDAGSPLAQDVSPPTEATEAANTSLARADGNSGKSTASPSPTSGNDDPLVELSASAMSASAMSESQSPVGDEIRIAQAETERATSDSRDSEDSGESQPSVTQAIEGGGTSSPGRSARALAVRTSTNSAMPSLDSADASDGDRRGVELDATGSRPRQSAAGALTDTVVDFGAASADEIVDGTPDGLAQPSFERAAEVGSSGQAFALSTDNLGATRRRRRLQIGGTSTRVELDADKFAEALTGGGNVSNNSEEAAEPTEFAANELAANGDASNRENEPGADGSQSIEKLSGLTGQNALPADGKLLVDLDAVPGAGGLGDEPDLDTGIVSRNSSKESSFVSLQPSRFMRRTRPGAAVATNTNVVIPTKAFRRRVIRKGEELAGERGFPSPKTEAAIELGLVFLSRFQSDDGSWSFHNFAEGKAQLPEGEEAIMVSDTGATGLALLSYLGAGYHHRDDKYQERVQAGIDFLVQRQNEDGDLYVSQDTNTSRSAWLYSHGIATLALCEAYGMTQDPALRRPAQLALNFIAESQNAKGGWRYSPTYGSDTSVSGWMLMALKSGELANLDVEEETYERVRKWLDLAQASEAQPYLFRYNPYAPDTPEQKHGRQATRAITAVGLLMRMYTGWNRRDANMILGARTLALNPPILGTSSRPRRDTYYWYYATQVMFHMGGKYWAAWNKQLHPMLTKSQVKDGLLAGSWDPQAPVPDRWGSYGGRLYVTTMNLLSLEVFYRHLPLYEDTGGKLQSPNNSRKASSRIQR